MDIVSHHVWFVFVCVSWRATSHWHYQYLAMSDTEFHSVISPSSKLCQLCCLLEGEADPFDVSANFGQNMFQLKRLIQGERAVLRGSHIVLWKVGLF